MAGQRDTIEFTADGQVIAALIARHVTSDARPGALVQARPVAGG